MAAPDLRPRTASNPASKGPIRRVGRHFCALRLRWRQAKRTGGRAGGAFRGVQGGRGTPQGRRNAHRNRQAANP
eukprot:1172813-Alexandrium_andersonii.AAC.1